MKSHRTHAPKLPTEQESVFRTPLLGKKAADGKKRRLDKLNAAIREYLFWYDMEEREKAHRQTCKYPRCFHHSDFGFLKETRDKMDKIWAECRKDGIV